MSGHLNEGRGRCRGTAAILVKPVRAVVELGAIDDVHSRVLASAHHANRRGPTDDFIAVSFPRMRAERGRMLSGDEIRLFGTEASLSAFMDLEHVRTLVRRGMLEDCAIEEIRPAAGRDGAAYVRDRAGAKDTEGWLRRAKARAERRGKPWKDRPARPRPHAPGALALRYGNIVLRVRRVAAATSHAPLLVSTYGFSSPASMAVLPGARADPPDAA